MYSVEKVAERILAARIIPPIQLAETQKFAAETAATFRLIAPKLALCIVDVRSSKAFSTDVAEAFIALLRKDSPAVERSALLYSPGGSLGLQLMRMIRESGSKDRRISTDDRVTALNFLGAVASPDEIDRIDEFLGL